MSWVLCSGMAQGWLHHSINAVINFANQRFHFKGREGGRKTVGGLDLQVSNIHTQDTAGVWFRIQCYQDRPRKVNLEQRGNIADNMVTHFYYYYYYWDGEVGEGKQGSPRHWFTLQVPTVSGAGQALKPGAKNAIRSPMWMPGTQLAEPSLPPARE